VRRRPHKNTNTADPAARGPADRAYGPGRRLQRRPPPTETRQDLEAGRGAAVRKRFTPSPLNRRGPRVGLNPLAQQGVDALALADVGATFTVPPRQIVESLGRRRWATGRSKRRKITTTASEDPGEAWIDPRFELAGTRRGANRRTALEALGPAVDQAADNRTRTNRSSD
jgi:hypothetical protein